ncbi:hypothetical protein A5906_30675 [Bradyrhizobium sacchari]|nr:hypothetical protein A5906_30675 [Bradyrhizobium sacchari]
MSPAARKHTGERLTAKHFFNLATAAFAIVAAGLWFLSAKVNSGNKFAGVKGPIGMREEAEKLNALGAAYNLQSTFNALAASAAGASALCQAAVVFLDW